jgi:hypothetical protein
LGAIAFQYHFSLREEEKKKRARFSYEEIHERAVLLDYVVAQLKPSVM